MAGTGPSEKKRKRKKVANDSSESEEEGASASENEWGDHDNNDYLDFLKEFLFPGQNNSMEINDDDEADPEYNITEDEEEEDHDREELRRDPAVKISKKELNELLAEVFDESVVPKKKLKIKKTSDTNPVQIQQSEVTNSVELQTQHKLQDEQQPLDQSISIGISPERNNLNNTSIAIPVTEDPSSKPLEMPLHVEVENKVEPLITETTVLQIKCQLQQHIQLLSQTYVLTAACYNSENSLKLAKESKKMISELCGFSNSYGPFSVFKAKNIQYAFNLVNTFPASSNMVSKSPIKKKILEERYNNELFQISGGNGLLFTRNIVKTISENPVFMYPELLPSYPNLQSDFKINFTPNEDALIAIGYREMHENPNYDILKTRQKAKLIGDMLLPGRPTLQIFHRIKNARKMDKNDKSIHHRGLQILRQYLKGETTPESPMASCTPDFLQLDPIAPIHQAALPVTWIALIKRLKLDTLFKDDVDEKVEKKPRVHSKSSSGKRRKSQNNIQNQSGVSSISSSNTKSEDVVERSLKSKRVNSPSRRCANNRNSLRTVNFDTKPLTVFDRSEFLSPLASNSSIHNNLLTGEAMERIPVLNKDGIPAAYVNIPKRFFRASLSLEEDLPAPSTSLSESSSSSQRSATAAVTSPIQQMLDVTPVGAPFSLSVLQSDNISTVDTRCIIDVQSLESPLKREIFQRASQSPTEPEPTASRLLVPSTTGNVDMLKPSKNLEKSNKISRRKKVLQNNKKQVSSMEQDIDLLSLKTPSPKPAIAETSVVVNSFEKQFTEKPASLSEFQFAETNLGSADVEYKVYSTRSREDHSARTWIYQRKSLAEIHAAIERKLDEEKRKPGSLSLPALTSESDSDDSVEIHDSSSSEEDDDEEGEIPPQGSVNNISSSFSHLSAPELSSDSQSQDDESFNEDHGSDLDTPFKSSKIKIVRDSEKHEEAQPVDAGESKNDGSVNKSGNSGNSSGAGTSRGSGANCRKDKQPGGRNGQAVGTGDGDEEDEDPSLPNRQGNPSEKIDDGDHKEEDTEDCEDDEKETSDHSSPRRSNQSNNHRTKSETLGSKSTCNSQTPSGKKIKRSPGSQVKKRITKYKTADIQKLLEDADSEVNIEAIESAFAEEFWAKCQHTVDPVLYNNLLQVFCDFEEKHSSEEEVFTKVEEMLRDYPDLLVDLATMIEPQLLQKNNLLKDNYVCQAYIRFMHLLEKLTLQCPPLKARVLQKLRAIRDLEKVTEKDVQELVDLYFQGNPIMTDALKAMFPAIFPPESIVRAEDFEDINLDDDSVMGTTEEAMAVELINLPEEANVPATTSCPCECHTDPRNVSYHAKARHCRKCCIKFQDGKVFMHSGRLMKQVNISFTSKEKAEQILAGTACGNCFESLKAKSSGSPDGKLKSMNKRSPKKRTAAASRLKSIIGSDGDSEGEIMKDLGETKLGEGGGGSHSLNRRDGNQSQEEDDLEEGEIVDDEDYDAEGDDDQSEREISTSKSKQQPETSSGNTKCSFDTFKPQHAENHQQKEGEGQDRRKSEKLWSFDDDKILLLTCQQEQSPTIAIEKILRSKSLPCRTAEDIRDRLSYLLGMIRKSQIQIKEGDGENE